MSLIPQTPDTPDTPQTPPPETAENLPAPKPKKFDWATAGAATGGIAYKGVQSRMVGQLLGATYFPPGTPEEDKFIKTNALLALAASMEPRDAMEAQMIAQMLGAHNIAMDLLERANHPGLMAEARALQMKHAEKFMRVYAEQMRTLEQYRARDARRVVVEQVNVESGGQAIVGVVNNAGARGNGKGNGLGKGDTMSHRVPHAEQK